MKKTIVLSLSAIVILCAGAALGYTFNCYKNKLAVIDIAAVVSKSTQVSDLKFDMENKTQALTQWLKNAQNEVKSEKDEEKQKALLQKYNDEFAQKRGEISRDYNKKLQAVDKDINDTIAKIAQEKGYKSVITKSVVVYGGDDITEEVIKAVK